MAEIPLTLNGQNIPENHCMAEIKIFPLHGKDPFLSHSLSLNGRKLVESDATLLPSFIETPIC